ncbi:MAG: lipopolysaccharide transport periplasmic protein LptA [Desulfuromonadales bacterium]|nr:lipopolysaccharide transport periplasmic protein LptA [Desulfuromonadales bacterium]
MQKIVLLSLLLVIAAFSLVCAEPDVSERKGPVEVSADRMEADDQANQLVFVGNAVATQDDITISADRLVVKYGGQEKKVEQLVAQGHVRIAQGERIATGDKAIFFQVEQKIVLSGAPKVSDQKNFIEGHEITLYLKDERSVISGGDGGRVSAQFFPKSEEP